MRLLLDFGLLVIVFERELLDAPSGFRLSATVFSAPSQA
jgi:hypothetical protein